MYKIWFTNFGYYAQDTFRGISDAKEYAKQKCFDCLIIDYSSNEPVYSYTPLNGFRSL